MEQHPLVRYRHTKGNGKYLRMYDLQAFTVPLMSA